MGGNLGITVGMSFGNSCWFQHCAHQALHFTIGVMDLWYHLWQVLQICTCDFCFLGEIFTFKIVLPEVPQCGVLLVSLVELRRCVWDVAACVYQLINIEMYLFWSKGTLLQSCFASSYSTEVAEICVQFNGITKSPCVFRFRYLGTALFFTAILSIPIRYIYQTLVFGYIGCAEYIWIPTIKWWRRGRQ